MTHLVAKLIFRFQNRHSPNRLFLGIVITIRIKATDTVCILVYNIEVVIFERIRRYLIWTSADKHACTSICLDLILDHNLARALSNGHKNSRVLVQSKSISEFVHNLLVSKASDICNIITVLQIFPNVHGLGIRKFHDTIGYCLRDVPRSCVQMTREVVNRPEEGSTKW